MRYKGIFIVFISCLISLIACKKSKDAVDTVVFGETNNMTVRSIDNDSADVDGDRINDVCLIWQSVKTGPGPSNGHKVTLRCLTENIAIRSEPMIVNHFKYDTVFLYHGNLGWQKIFQTTNGCAAHSGATLTSSSVEDRFVSFSRGQAAKLSESFKSTEQLISDVTDFSIFLEPRGDTTYYFTTYTQGCGTIIHNGENYFCFRINYAKHREIGWIKINGDKIEEAAISKSK